MLKFNDFLKINETSNNILLIMDEIKDELEKSIFPLLGDNFDFKSSDGGLYIEDNFGLKIKIFYDKSTDKITIEIDPKGKASYEFSYSIEENSVKNIIDLITMEIDNRELNDEDIQPDSVIKNKKTEKIDKNKIDINKVRSVLFQAEIMSELKFNGINLNVLLNRMLES